MNKSIQKLESRYTKMLKYGAIGIHLDGVKMCKTVKDWITEHNELKYVSGILYRK